MSRSVIEIKDPRRLAKLVSAEAIKQIEDWRKKYPSDRKRPPIMATLKIVQEENDNFLTEDLMQSVADYLEVPHIAVYEVATFYTMFHLKPVGQYVISLCTNLSCSMCGAKNILEHLTKRLNIQLGETTNDGRFTLHEVECMAACGGAPMFEVDKVYYENLTPEKVDSILKQLGWQEASYE